MSDMTYTDDTVKTVYNGHSKKGRYFILPVPNSVSGTCLCNILKHKVSQHNFHNIHLLNVDSKFRDTEYEVRGPQESPCISIDQIISGQK